MTEYGGTNSDGTVFILTHPPPQSPPVASSARAPSALRLGHGSKSAGLTWRWTRLLERGRLCRQHRTDVAGRDLGDHWRPERLHRLNQPHPDQRTSAIECRHGRATGHRQYGRWRQCRAQAPRSTGRNRNCWRRLRSKSTVASTFRLFSDGATFGLPTSISGVTSPRQSLQIITLYGGGFGSVTHSIPAGQIVQQSNTLTAPFHVLFGSDKSTFQYDGLVPGAVGPVSVQGSGAGPGGQQRRAADLRACRSGGHADVHRGPIVRPRRPPLRPVRQSPVANRSRSLIETLQSRQGDLEP